MNYDSWKLAGDIDPRTEGLSDRCSQIEAGVDNTLALVLTQLNRAAECQWEAEPTLADFRDDGTMALEVNLRLRHVPVDGSPDDLQELAQAFLKVGQSLSQLAQNQTPQGLKLAPSVSSRPADRNVDLG